MRDLNCGQCIHRYKDFIKEEPCYSCTDPDENKRVNGFYSIAEFKKKGGFFPEGTGVQDEDI